MNPLPIDQVLHGDCCEVLTQLPDSCVDLVLTDPPYLVNYRDRAGRTIAGDRDAAWLAPAFREVYRVMNREVYRVMKPDTVCVSFYGWSCVDLFFRAWQGAGLKPVGHITFPKRYTSSTRLLRYQHENAYVLAKGNPAPSGHPIGDVIEWTYTGNKAHPTQKPLSILMPLIDAFSRRHGVVLDPFAGSGSSCLAARARGRRFIGVEIDRRHHEVAMQRLRALSARLAALAQAGAALEHDTPLGRFSAPKHGHGAVSRAEA